jgi:hypothetical protein
MTYQICSDLEGLSTSGQRTASSLDEAVDDFQYVVNLAFSLYPKFKVVYALHLFVEGQPFMTVGDSGYIESTDDLQKKALRSKEVVA